MITSLHLLHFLHLLIALRAPQTLSDFTVVLPDSTSPLLDSPQTGFSSRARTDPVEQQAVYDVMASTGNSWAGSIPDVCRGRWHGIECVPDKDNDVYHVVSLSFGALSDDTAFPSCDPTTASLSPSLLNLTHLRTLFFYRCFVNNPQPIPSFLGRLGPTVRSLVLRENGHVGPIPADLASLTSLKLLDLHGNRLGSSIPPALAKLTQIRKLDLSNNQLSGGIPTLKFPSLSVLDLSRNYLRGRIPVSLTRSDSIIKLDLSRNRLTGPIPESINNLRSLILLDLSRNSLSGPLPRSFKGLASLRALILEGNPMASTAIPINGLSGLKELSTLDLSDMGLVGPIPESMAELTSLRVVHLNGNELNGLIPRSFRKLEKLSELRLEDNRLIGSVPFSREMIWRMGRKLRIGNNSGLCYDMRDGSLEGLDSMLTIGYCDPEMKKGRTTKHLSLPIRRGDLDSSLSSNCESLGVRVMIVLVSWWSVFLVLSL